MSKFKAGDEVIVKYEEFYSEYYRYGDLLIVKSYASDSGRLFVQSKRTGLEFFILEKRVDFKNKIQEKKYTETDRRKAAKQVRLAEKKLSDAIKKAKETGIEVSLVNMNVGLINVEMSFQPETPEMRIYK